MKKKILIASLAVCLIAILSFSTLAWFSSTDSVKNTFTVGSVKIQQNEQQHQHVPDHFHLLHHIIRSLL